MHQHAYTRDVMHAPCICTVPLMHHHPHLLSLLSCLQSGYKSTLKLNRVDCCEQAISLITDEMFPIELDDEPVVRTMKLFSEEELQVIKKENDDRSRPVMQPRHAQQQNSPTEFGESQHAARGAFRVMLVGAQLADKSKGTLPSPVVEDGNCQRNNAGIDDGSSARGGAAAGKDKATRGTKSGVRNPTSASETANKAPKKSRTSRKANLLEAQAEKSAYELSRDAAKAANDEVLISLGLKVMCRKPRTYSSRPCLQNSHMLPFYTFR